MEVMWSEDGGDEIRGQRMEVMRSEDGVMRSENGGDEVRGWG